MSQQVTSITPYSRWWIPDFKKIWECRELFCMFVYRQFIIRYKQTILGVLWALLKPLGQLFVFWLLFSVLLKVQTEGHPYVVYAFSGMIPWTVFATSALAVSNSLAEQMGIVSKISFPRIILPFISLAREGIDACISLVLLLAVCVAFGYYPAFIWLLMPLVLLCSLLCGLAVGLLFAGPIVRFRDLQVPLGYVIQLAMFVTPVIYPPTVIPPQYLWLIELNPMYWVIQVSRNALLGTPVAVTPLMYLGIAGTCLLLFLGWIVFAYTERSIVDVQ